MEATGIGVRALGVLVLAGCLVGGLSPTARAESNAPEKLGCPQGFDLASVVSFTDVGPYILPGLVDGAGNGDGWVCASPRPAGYAQADCDRGGVIACELIEMGLPLYHFVDNDVPGQTATA